MVHIIPILQRKKLRKKERLIDLSRIIHMVNGRSQYLNYGLLGSKIYMDLTVS